LSLGMSEAHCVEGHRMARFGSRQAQSPVSVCRQFFSQWITQAAVNTLPKSATSWSLVSDE
jgi:hypothetical protein